MYDPENLLNPIRADHPTTPFQPLNSSPRPSHEPALPNMSMYPSLMALQAGLPLFDFSVMAGTGKTSCIGASQAGLAKHYAPMESLFGEVIEQSRSLFSSQGSLADPRVRASNEHILIVRVPRAEGRPGCLFHPSKLAGYFPGMGAE